MFYGPHVCGESVDVCGNEILTGSWRPEDQLEIWDFSTAKKITGLMRNFFDIKILCINTSKKFLYHHPCMLIFVFLCSS